MIIGNMDGQYLSGEIAYGEDLRRAFEEHRIEGIPEGLIMVARFNNHLEYFFEVGKWIETSSLKAATLMYPRPGSIFPLRKIPAGITKKMMESKTCVFRKCRLPNHAEYSMYLDAETI